MKNVKEIVKIGFLFFFVVFFAIFFVATKGNDELNFNINLDFSTEEEFSFPITKSEYNGQYRNIKDNGVYTLIGANADGTYRIYFIHQVKSAKNVILKLDSAQLKGKEIEFVDMHSTKLKLTFNSNGYTISGGLGLGNADLEGTYTKVKDINKFSLSEYQYYVH